MALLQNPLTAEVRTYGQRRFIASMGSYGQKGLNNSHAIATMYPCCLGMCLLLTLSGLQPQVLRFTPVQEHLPAHQSLFQLPPARQWHGTHQQQLVRRGGERLR